MTLKAGWWAALLICSVAAADPVTFQYSAGAGDFSNSSGYVNFKDGSSPTFVSDSGSTPAQFPALNDFVLNNRSATGSFAYDTSTTPANASGGNSTFFPSAVSMNLVLPATSQQGAGVGSSSVSLPQNFFSVTDAPAGTSSSPYADQFFGYFYNNNPSGLSLATTGSDFKLDLKQGFADAGNSVALPDLPAIPVHAQGINQLNLYSASINVTGNSALLDRSDVLPSQIDLNASKQAGGLRSMVLDFRGTAATLYVDPADYATPADYQTANNFVQQNLTTIAVDQYVNYNLSSLTSSAPATPVIAPPGYFYASAHSVGDGQFSYHSESTNGGAGQSTASTYVGGTPGTSTAHAYLNAAGNPSVGVQVLASTYYKMQSRAVAYNSYSYSGAANTPVTLNLAFDGVYTDPAFHLGNGGFDVELGALILDRNSFNQYVAAHGDGLLQSLDFDDLKSTLGGMVLGWAKAGGDNPFDGIVESDPDTYGTHDLTAALKSTPVSFADDQQFIVLLDMYAYSNGGGDYQGGPDLYLADTFQFAFNPFQTLDGQAVSDIAPIPVPEPTAAATILAGAALLVRRRRIR